MSIRAFSERLLPPYSGQVQIAQSDTYRALTIDGQVWEIQYVNRSHVRVATLSASDIKAHAHSPELLEHTTNDPLLKDLLDYLAGVELPFPATDHYEYWLLDPRDQSPLALIFSCSQEAQMDKFPARPEWTALPSAVMPVAKTEAEQQSNAAPVNYRLESQVAERSGTRAQAQWFDRRQHSDHNFPPFMITEIWTEETQSELCQRYIERQAPRLLMLHGLTTDERSRLESYCRSQAMEVARFANLYPEIIDQSLIQSLRVEAKLREASGSAGQPALHNRRDGILYI